MKNQKKETEQRLVFNKLYDQYVYLNLPLDTIDAETEFTIHNLKDIHPDLPYHSPVYRTNFFSFVFVKDGSGHYTTDEQVFRTEPGMIYFTNPGHFKSFEWETLEQVYLVTLSESFLKENVHPNIFDEFPFLLAETVPPKVLRPEAFEEFEQLYLQVLNIYNSSSPYKSRMIGSLFVVLLLKVKEYFWHSYNPIYEGNRSSQIVKTFKNMLEKHYRSLSEGKEPVLYQVQDYARLQNLHPSYLSNVIKSKTGKSISSWIADKTMAEAKSRLKNSTDSIKEITFQLGFSESTNFSNFFKKHTGLSPNAYRKQEQGI